jgi:hypothetical protein
MQLRGVLLNRASGRSFVNVCSCLRHCEWHEVEICGEAHCVVLLALHAYLLLHQFQVVVRVHRQNLQHVIPVNHLQSHVAASRCDQYCAMIAYGDVVESSISGWSWNAAISYRRGSSRYSASSALSSMSSQRLPRVSTSQLRKSSYKSAFGLCLPWTLSRPKMSRTLWSNRAALLACIQSTQPPGVFALQVWANSMASCDFLLLYE